MLHMGDDDGPYHLSENWALPRPALRQGGRKAVKTAFQPERVIRVTASRDFRGISSRPIVGGPVFHGSPDSIPAPPGEGKEPINEET